MGDYFSYRGYTVGEWAVNPTQIYSTGGIDFPHLAIPAKLTFSPYAGRDGISQELLYFTIQTDLALGERPTKIARSFQPFQYRITNERYETQHFFEIPLDRYRVEKIESARNGNLSLKLNVQIGMATFGLPEYGPDQGKGQPHLNSFHTLHSDINLNVPSSVWLNNVLPNLGYGIVNVIELPATPIEQIAAMQHSFTALQRANERFKNGDYDESVGFCRTAIDPIRNELKKIKISSPENLAADWAEKIGDSTVAWLNTILGKTHGVANTPHHSPNTGHFSRLDAQMILTVTASVIAFVARSGFQNKRKAAKQ
jgi:hypothetical protein